MITKPIDLLLLTFLLSKEEPMTTTEIAKRFFNVKERYEIIGKSTWVRYWLEKKAKEGIISKKNNGSKVIYTINKDNVKVGRAVFINWSTKQTEVIDVIGIKTKQFGWVFYEIPPGFELVEE